MANIFVISDTHFCHKNILTFMDSRTPNTLLRPGFMDVDHMNEIIIQNWNKVVQPQDKVYHLGDFTFGSKNNIEKIAPRLNGHKRLILGNHDYDAKFYYPYFEQVMSWRQFGLDKFKRPVFLCHYPLDIAAFDYRARDALNIHGHLHSSITDKPYHVNVCVEKINYTPRTIEEIIDENT